MENQKSNKINKLEINYLNLLNFFRKEISKEAKNSKEIKTKNFISL